MKSPRVVIIVVISLVALFSLATSEVSGAKPSARVTDVRHPDKVRPAESFEIAIIAEYSDSFLVDVGIWDAETGEVVRSVTLISSFTGPGGEDFTFQLTAPDTNQDWNLIAVTRIWYEDGWYQDPNGGAMSFRIVISDQAVLTIGSSGVETTIKLDGHEHQVGSDASLTVVLEPGFHWIEALQIVPDKLGQRFRFVGWSDGINSNPRQVLLLRDLQIDAVYRTEYFLSVESNMGKAVGTGWYAQGSEVSFATSHPEHGQSQFWFVAYDYRFAGWSGDSYSTEELASVRMDAPKTVKATWVQDRIVVDLSNLTTTILLIAIPLGVRGTYFSLRKRLRNAKGHRKELLLCLKMGMLSLSILGSSVVSPVQAQMPAQSDARVVMIGDAYWYVWDRIATDTCLLWLGGGISQETVIGYNYYWINPFEYESFGTIRFVQDLAEYFCVIALQKGSYKSFNEAANRTIHQQLYNVQSTIIAQVHDWIRKQGYRHTFVIGYSVGGQAAAMELSMRDPENWSSADGLILITVPLVSNVIDHARVLRANLMFLYGGDLPDFVATGQRYYDSAPEEGLTGSSYFHKEFHVLSDVGHEVWTVRDTGEYAARALNLVVDFIQKSKALQFTSFVNSNAPFPPEGATLNFTELAIPGRVMPDNVFSITADVLSASDQMAAVVVYDTARRELLAATSFFATTGPNVVSIVIPPLTETANFSALLLRQVDEVWRLVSRIDDVEVEVSDRLRLSVQTSTANITVVVDGVIKVVPASGVVQYEATRGLHTIQLQPMIVLDNGTRFVFVRWGDFALDPYREVVLERDSELVAVFKKQFYLNVTSALGTASGSGWYDAGSMATMSVSPPLIRDPRAIFVGWIGGLEEVSPSVTVEMDRPRAIQAIWEGADSSRSQTDSWDLAWFIVALLFLVLSVSSNIPPHRISFRSQKEETVTENR